VESSRTSLRIWEWLALALGIAVAHLFYLRVAEYPSDYDAQSYLDMAAEIGSNGLFTKYQWSQIRTYGYPLFLNLPMRVASALHLPVGLVVFELQLAIYVLASVFLRRSMARLWPSIAPWAFAAIVLNPFALLYAPETLTESLSVSLILTGAGIWLALVSARGPVIANVFLGSLVMGLAVMMRPANLFVLATWVFAVAAVLVRRRPGARVLLSNAAALVTGCSLPAVPQYVNNLRNYGEHTPLIVARLGHDQQVWGISNIKYATMILSLTSKTLEHPRTFYANPFATGTTIDRENPLSWYVQNPVAGAATIGLHLFNMLDQDLLFTYSRDLDPWYRVPVGVLNHAMIALALVGAGLLVARARHDPGLVAPTLALAVYTLAHLGLHATTLVEMRFGLPLLLLAAPVALVGLRQLVSPSSWRSLAMASAFVAVWVLGSLALSNWVRQQAPLIREWQKGDSAFKGRREPGVHAPLAPRRDTDPKKGWDRNLEKARPKKKG
jgi:hypothetical protein